MNELFKDKEHLLRVAVLFVAGFLIFLLARAILVPEGFGEYGHYRSGALKDNASRKLHFAGRAACEGCHTDVVGVRKGSKHEKVSCETCHKPQKDHADNPSSVKPERPNGKDLCLNCHAQNVARPKSFPQVNTKDHGTNGPCTECHKPHHPEIS